MVNAMNGYYMRGMVDETVEFGTTVLYRRSGVLTTSVVDTDTGSKEGSIQKADIARDASRSTASRTGRVEHSNESYKSRHAWEFDSRK